MTNAEHYTYRVRWSAQDAAHIGTVAEMPSLSWAAETQADAFAGIRFLAIDAAEQHVSLNRLAASRLVGT